MHLFAVLWESTPHVFGSFSLTTLLDVVLAAEWSNSGMNCPLERSPASIEQQHKRFAQHQTRTQWLKLPSP